VIDDVNNISVNSITAINRLVEAGGTVVILCQHRDDLRAPITNAVWLKLDKNGLKIQD
jgi:phage head maturation protease